MSSTGSSQVLSEKLGGHVLVDSLRTHGVEMVFGVPGESYLAVLDGLQDANSIQTIICRQEGGATMMAEAYYIPVSPHDASGPINIMAGAHVSATIPNFYKLETIRYDLSGYNRLIDRPLDIREGNLFLSDQPGLGINLDQEFLRAHSLSGYGDT